MSPTVMVGFALVTCMLFLGAIDRNIVNDFCLLNVLIVTARRRLVDLNFAETCFTVKLLSNGKVKSVLAKIGEVVR